MRTADTHGQPSNPQQASQRPPGADHVEVDVGALTGDDVVEVLLMSERQGGEVEQGIAPACLGPVDDAGDVVAGDRAPSLSGWAWPVNDVMRLRSS